MAKRKIIKLSEQLIRKISRLNARETVMLYGRAENVFDHSGSRYLVTGSISHRHKVMYVTAYELTLIQQYTGQLKPLHCHMHWQEVQWGKRKSSYKGMLINYRQLEYVVTSDEIRFEPLETPQQTELNLF